MIASQVARAGAYSDVVPVVEDFVTEMCNNNGEKLARDSGGFCRRLVARRRLTLVCLSQIWI